MPNAELGVVLKPSVLVVVGLITALAGCVATKYPESRPGPYPEDRLTVRQGSIYEPVENWPASPCSVHYTWIELPPSPVHLSVLEGRLLFGNEDDSNAPAIEGRLRVRGEKESKSYVVLAGKDGRFHLRGLKPGEYRFTACVEGGFATYLGRFVIDSTAPEDARLIIWVREDS